MTKALQCHSTIKGVHTEISHHNKRIPWTGATFKERSEYFKRFFMRKKEHFALPICHLGLSVSFCICSCQIYGLLLIIFDPIACRNVSFFMWFSLEPNIAHRSMCQNCLLFRLCLCLLHIYYDNLDCTLIVCNSTLLSRKVYYVIWSLLNVLFPYNCICTLTVYLVPCFYSYIIAYLCCPIFHL